MLLNGTGASVSAQHSGPSSLTVAVAAMAGLPFPCRHQTAPASSPPTTTLRLLHRPFQSFRRHLRREHKTNSPRRPPLTSSSRHVHLATNIASITAPTFTTRKTHLPSPRPSSTSFPTNLNGLLQPHRRPYKVLLLPPAIVTPSPAWSCRRRHV